MKSGIVILFLLVGINSINAQQSAADDSLKAVINLKKGDTAEVNALVGLSYQQVQFDSAIKYAEHGMALAKKIEYKKGEADCFFMQAMAYNTNRNYTQIIKNLLNALKVYEEIQNSVGIATTHLMLQGNYREVFDYRNALLHGILGEQIAETKNLKAVFAFPGQRLAPLFLAEIGQTYLLMNKLDSAYIYTQKSIDQKALFNGAQWGFPVYLLGTIQTMQGKYKAALENYRQALVLHAKNDQFRDTLQTFSGISTLYKMTGQHDSAIHYANLIVHSTNPELETKSLLEAMGNLAVEYKIVGKNDSALKYTEQLYALKDSLFSKEKDRDLQNIAFNEQLNQQQILSAQGKYKSKVQLFVLIAGMCGLLLIAVILWRNNRHRIKAYTELQKQKEETDFQKLKVEQAFDELTSTQAQLVQREKMASLGELTAGIAHEIQNPLNFVNNFSEVNKELIEELKGERYKAEGERNRELEDQLLSDLKQNLEKINQHGRRADSIVKGMLQHSRSSMGQKELTDINALADEYLRLSYHGMRAKDKTFNAALQTDFDKGLDKISIIPQDIGRVLVNLYNNAFYAIGERFKVNGLGYEPAISVTTKKIDGKIQITVRDYGTGIPEKIKDKIFQPFFTTKPTGQGTGLGLSLSYDIVKAHGGEISVNSKEGEGAEFMILLPI